MCLILNGYRDTAVAIYRPKCVTFVFMGLEEEKSLQNKGGYTRLIVRSHCESCIPHKETWRSTQTNNMRSSHTSFKVHWGWRWDFQTFIVSCNNIYRFCITDISLKHEIKLAVSNFLFLHFHSQSLCIFIFKKLYLIYHSELDTHSYELFFHNDR
jgi:hypothetical protein